MTKWTHDHPIATHLINLMITALFIVISAFVLKYYYGDKILQIYEQTNTIYEVITSM
jgi:hypothetical protein